MSSKPVGLPPKILNQLRQLLPICGPFESNKRLRECFTDDRIAHWRNQLPEAESIESRVDALIDFLFQRRNSGQENGLVLFLDYLRDRVSPEDSCHAQLVEVANWLRNQEWPEVAEIVLADEPAPYCGLSPFEDPDFFFGREQEIENLQARLEKAPFIAVVGASGSGKSSLVRAGLLPVLRKQSWRSLIMSPGSRPVRTLADLIATFHPEERRLEETDKLEERFLSRPDGLQTALSSYLTGRDKKLLLFIDQFEELFTQQVSRKEQKAFIDNLVACGSGRVNIVLTLRSDFITPCLEFPNLAKLLETNQLFLGPLDEQGLRAIIEQPAAKRGAKFAEGLVERLLEEMKGQPAGTLPLLQMALQQLWEKRKGEWLTHKAYDDTGRVAGAIQTRAEKIYSGLNETQQSLARKLFIRLTTSDSSQTAHTRRRIPLSELDLVGTTPADWQPILLAFSASDARLITLDSESVIATHEALFGQWEQLKKWLERAKTWRPLLFKLNQDTQTWEVANQDPSYLYAGAKLQQMQNVIPNDELTLAQKTFIKASIDHQNQQTTVAKHNSQTRRALTIALTAMLALIPLFLGYLLLLKFMAIQATELVHFPDAPVVRLSSREIWPPPEATIITRSVSAFYLEKYEVSYYQYNLCQRAFVCDSLNMPEDKNLPVVNVTLAQANTYCQWIGRRLPTELEWATAAYGPDNRHYPWGDSPKPTSDNHIFNLNDNSTGSITVKGLDTYSSTEEDLVNMAGNVWEWTTSISIERKLYEPDVWQPDSQFESDTLVIVRGGGWKEDYYQNEKDEITFLERMGLLPAFSQDDIGFRCADS